jgi:GT2 family glycosyltransferase
MTLLSLIVGLIGPRETVVRAADNFIEVQNSLLEYNLKLILVHQTDNADDVEFLTKTFSKKNSILYISTQDYGLSNARNIALDKTSSKYVMFLDDNSYFEKEILDKLLVMLNTEKSPNALIIGVRSVDRKSSTHSKYKSECLVSIDKIPGRVCSNGIVVKYELAKSLKFNCDLGVGAKYGACEDWDFVWRLTKVCDKIRYIPSLYVIHPPAGKFSNRKSYNYGMGHGYFVKIVCNGSFGTHELLFVLNRLIVLVAKTLFGILLNSANARAWSKGFINGFFAKKK